MKRAVVIGPRDPARSWCDTINRRSDRWQMHAFANTRAGVLRALPSLRSASALVAFGGPGPHGILADAARRWRIPVFVIWTGDDVLRAIEGSQTTMVHVRRAGFVHMASAPWLVEELSQAGLAAGLIEIVGMALPNQAAAPGGFRVGVVVPNRKRDAQGVQRIYDMAKRCHEVEFLCVCAGRSDSEAPHNVAFFDAKDSGSLVERCEALVSMPSHDGMSLAVLEALARGRAVAWTHALPGVAVVRSVHDAVEFVRAVQARRSSGGSATNLAGRQYVAERHDPQLVADAAVSLLERPVVPAVPEPLKPHQVAISGLDLYAADVADESARIGAPWRAELLHFRMKYNIIRSIMKLLASDVWYSIGSAVVHPLVTAAAGLVRKPRVMHWAGTDVLIAKQNPAALRALRQPWVRHLAVAEWLARELAEVGINPRIVPLPPQLTPVSEVPSLPPTLTLLLYVPRLRMEFYGKAEFERLIELNKREDISFIVVGGGYVEVSEGCRVTQLGWRASLQDVYPRCTALVRFTEHDGLSLMVLEALSLGRYVLWSNPFEYVTHVQDFNDMARAVQDLKARHQAGLLTPQAGAVRFVRERYDRERCVREIISAWEDALPPQRVPRS